MSVYFLLFIQSFPPSPPATFPFYRYVTSDSSFKIRTPLLYSFSYSYAHFPLFCIFHLNFTPPPPAIFSFYLQSWCHGNISSPQLLPQHITKSADLTVTFFTIGRLRGSFSNFCACRMIFSILKLDFFNTTRYIFTFLLHFPERQLFEIFLEYLNLRCTIFISSEFSQNKSETRNYKFLVENDLKE